MTLSSHSRSSSSVVPSTSAARPARFTTARELLRGNLDLDCADLIRRIRTSGAPPTELLSPQQAREVMLDRRSTTQLQSRAETSSSDHQVTHDGCTFLVRIYRPLFVAAEKPLPTVLYFHGGGWIMGDLDVYDATLRELCTRSGGMVVSVHYRLAPENTFPAAIDDASAALRWIRRVGSSIGADSRRIAIAGDSAGGNIATVAALLERDAGSEPLAFQLLIYPVTDLLMSSQSYLESSDHQLMTAETMRWFIENYVPNARHRSDWRASPLLCDDLTGLPPTLIVAAGFDPLREEGRRYADRLSLAGVSTRYICFERQIHGFFTMSRITPEASLAVDLAAAALRDAWQNV